MDISGLIQSYDSRVNSSAPQPRTTVAYIGPPYSSASSGNLTSTQSESPHNPFYSTYSTANIIVPLPAPSYGSNYIQHRPGFGLPRLIHPEVDLRSMVPYSRTIRQGFVEEQSQSPPSTEWNSVAPSPTFESTNVKSSLVTAPTAANPIETTFNTKVDTLMRAIQSKIKVDKPQELPTKHELVVGGSHINGHLVARDMLRPQRQFKLTHSEYQGETLKSAHPEKRWKCMFRRCGARFLQKTHLDIHERKHTGYKPYLCPEEGCGRRFSQQGNLKTHRRRHTGEKPYPCELCGKWFAQKGNVRAHMVIHGGTKPYLCRLQDCGKHSDKTFSQLGNLKSHQNKFHADFIRELTAKFASLKPGDFVEPADQELWDYFADLYKNSNKGIKGRGADRRVKNPNSNTTALHEMEVSRGGFTMAGFGSIVHHGLKMESEYGIFDSDADSQSRRSSTSGGSEHTMYDSEYDGAFGDRHNY